MKRYNLGEQIALTVLETDKFKDNMISMRFLFDLDQKKASARSLLAFMMTNRTAIHPTNQSLTSYLDDLYGMNISMNTYGLGACHMLELRCSAIADQFVQESYSMVIRQFELLKEVLFEPLLDEQGLFDEELFEEAKMIMRSRVLRRKDDPGSFAIDENNKRIGKGTPFAISCLGEADAIEALTREDVKQAYQELLSQTVIEIYVVGMVNQQQVQEMFEQQELFASRNCTYPVFYEWPQKELMKDEVQKDIDQTTLLLTWLTQINHTHPLYYALKVGNTMFGGDANSFLFRVVREQHSLCYTIYSSVYSMDEVLVALAGISYDKKEQTAALMEEQFQKLVDGNFDEGQLETSKKLMINGLQSQFDSTGGIINFLYQQTITQMNLSVEEVIERIRQVTREQVIEAMKSCQLVGEFVLRERDGVEDEINEEVSQ